MLEKLLSKLVLPACVLVSSLLPSKALANYISFVNVNNKEYMVEIDDNKKQIQIDAENKEIADLAASKALVNQKREELDRHTWDLTYETYDMIFRKPVKNAKTDANKANVLERLFKIKDAKIPWWPLAFGDPKELSPKMIAVENAWNYRNSAIKMLEKYYPENELNKAYSDLSLMDDSIQKMTIYIKKLNESTNDLIKRDEIYFIFEDFKKTINLNKLEDTAKDIADRYKLTNKKIEKLKNDLEEKLKESREYKDFRKSLSDRDLKKILKKYDTIYSSAEILFEGKYNVPLFTSANPDMQTSEGMEYADINVKIEKSNSKNNDFNLRLWLMTDKIFNKTQTSIFVFHNKKTSLGKISQKAYNLRTKKSQMTKQWEEIVPYGQDKSIVLQFEAVKWIFDKAIDETMRGKIIKTKNILSYFSDKIYENMLDANESDVKRILVQLKDSYSADEIKINSIKGFRQTAGYLFLIPVNNAENDDLLFHMNLGLQSGNLPTKEGYGTPSGYEEAFGRLEDIAINLKKYGDEEELKEMEEKWGSYNLYDYGMGGFVDSASFERKSKNCVIGTIVSGYRCRTDDGYDCTWEERKKKYTKGKSWEDASVEILENKRFKK